MSEESGEFEVGQGPLKGKKVTMSFQFPDNEPASFKPGSTHVAIKEVVRLSYDILDNVVSPLLKIKGISADVFRAALACYASDEEDMNKVVKAIAERYNVHEDEIDEFKDYPLAFLSLYIIGHASERE
jgi:hypothetical protein